MGSAEGSEADMKCLHIRTTDVQLDIAMRKKYLQRTPVHQIDPVR